MDANYRSRKKVHAVIEGGVDKRENPQVQQEEWKGIGFSNGTNKLGSSSGSDVLEELRFITCGVDDKKNAVSGKQQNRI